MKKTPHNRRFNQEELFNKRYTLVEREEAHLQEVEEAFEEDSEKPRDALLSQAPAIIQEELSRFNDWAAQQEDPRLTIVKMMRERKE